jgi:hypothetical protein
MIQSDVLEVSVLWPLCFLIYYINDPRGTTLAKTSSNSKLQTSPLLREGAKNNKPASVYRIFQGEGIIGRGSQMGA